MKLWIKMLATVTAAGMFLVLVMGAAVTNTGSEHGCGRSWPLCHGQFIPQMATATAIEFSHRAVVGVESTLIIALAAVAMAVYWRRLEVRILAPVMVGFLFLQAGLGAWAVMAPQNAAVLALHFGVSLIAFASVLLAVAFLFEMDGVEKLRAVPTPIAVKRLIWGTTIYMYGVVYLGAFVRHLDADEACSGWPLCNGAIVPVLDAKVTANLVHRIAAFLLVLVVVWLVWQCRQVRDRRPDLYRGAAIALGLVLLQALFGALVAWTRVDLFSALAHAGGAGALFGALSYLCLHSLPLPRQVVAMRQATAVA